MYYGWGPKNLTFDPNLLESGLPQQEADPSPQQGLEQNARFQVHRWGSTDIAFDPEASQSGDFTQLDSEQLLEQKSKGLVQKIKDWLTKNMSTLEGIESVPVAVLIALQALIIAASRGAAHSRLPERELIPVAVGSGFEIVGATVVAGAATTKFFLGKKTAADVFDASAVGVSGGAAFFSALFETWATLCEAKEQTAHELQQHPPEYCGSEQATSNIEMAAIGCMMLSAFADVLPLVREYVHIRHDPNHNVAARLGIALAILGDMVVMLGTLGLFETKGLWDKPDTAVALAMQATGFLMRSVGILAFASSHMLGKAVNKIWSYFSQQHPYTAPDIVRKLNRDELSALSPEQVDVELLLETDSSDAENTKHDEAITELAASRSEVQPTFFDSSALKPIGERVLMRSLSQQQISNSTEEDSLQHRDLTHSAP